VRGYDRLQVDEYVERLNEWAMVAQARASESEQRVAELENELRALRRHVRDLEDERPDTPEQAVRAAAERAAAAVADAIRDAGELRRQATEEAERIVEEARRHALDVVETARQSLFGLSEEGRQSRAEVRRQIDLLMQDATSQAEETRQRAQDEADHLVSGGRELAGRLVAEAEAQARAIRDRGATEQHHAEQALDQLKEERAQILAELNRLRGAIHNLISEGVEPDLVAPAEEATEQIEEATQPDA
jgi:cell division septum initiation protein DivIVA